MITSSEAKQLCAKGEYELFAISRPRTIKILTVKDLKSRIQRSRKARDKYAKLTGEQQRQARGKQAPKGTRPSQGSQRTSRKQQLFAETLARYEARLSELEQQEADSPAEKSASNQVKKTKKKAVRKQPAELAKKSKVTKNTKATKQTKSVKKAVTKGTKKKAVTGSKKAAAKQAPTRKKKPVSVSSQAKAPKKDKAKKKAVAMTKSGAALRQSAQLSSQMRTRKHTSAQSKRKQSRRDSR
jgi:histone H1/5